MHISLVLVLYEGVAAWLSCVKILDEMNALDRSELLELPPQFCLGGVIVYPCLEERFERVLVLGGVFLRVWVPECSCSNLYATCSSFSLCFISNLSLLSSALRGMRVPWGLSHWSDISAPMLWYSWTFFFA